MRRFRRFLARFAAVLLAGLLAFAVFELATWPDVASLRTEDPTTSAFIEAFKKRQQTAKNPVALHWKWVPYHRISPDLKCAVLVAEDINFFTHNGFETTELGQAVRDAWREKKLPRGASTISQQTAKNLWLSPSRSPWRKLKEAILTWQMETTLDKRRILEIYLNIAEMGPGVYGAGAASRVYFGCSADDLNAEQAAALAAGLSRPSRWNPSSTSRGYRQRVRSILHRMERAQWLLRVV